MPELINREADQRVRTNDTDLAGNTGSVAQAKSHPAVPVPICDGNHSRKARGRKRAINQNIK